MYEHLDEKGPCLFSIANSIRQVTFLKILIYSKSIDMVIKSLQRYKKDKIYYVAFDNDFVNINLIIDYLNSVSKKGKNYFDIIDDLIELGTYGMYSCGIEL